MKDPKPEPFVGGPSELRARARALRTKGANAPPDIGVYDHTYDNSNPVKINKNRGRNSYQLDGRRPF